MKKILIALGLALALLCFAPSAAAASPDEAVIISEQEGLTPLYTKAPDSSLRDHSGDMSRDEGILFYTQTTVLALVAGYLIVYKVRCIPHGEKMHRRRKK